MSDLGVFPQRSSLPDSTGSESSLNMVRDWLTDCVLHHSKCNTEELRTQCPPTRLIDIEKDTGKFCIVPGSEAAPDQAYIALSHRWGVKGASNVLLTTENERELSLGVPVTSLSQTFQDAIVVARHLRVRFLWIDCLCIIQEGDDGLDWEANARQMGDWYQNAYCVLSADDATDVEGLFFDRDPDFFSRATLQARADDGMSITDWTSVDRDMWFTEVNNSPLNSRGWVFQERMLAPRVIHFCRQEIFWECREKFCCESFPETLPPSEVFNLGDAVPLRQLPVELWESSGWHGDEKFPVEDVPYEAWDDVVKAYSKSHFSYPEDKLVAISGVAKYTKTVIKDTYLAGLWRKRLAAEMAWWLYPHRDRYVLGAGPPYYAPSFSWASVKGRINSAGPFAIGILVEVECVTMASGPQNCNQVDEIFHDDVFGTALRSPPFQIRVTGKLRSTRLAKEEGRGWRLNVTVLSATNDSTDPERPEGSSSGDIGLPTCVDLEPWLDVTIPDRDHDKIQSETFYLMDWRHGPQPGEYDMAKADLHCMILRQIDRERSQFQRMGWTRIYECRDEVKIGLLLSHSTKEILPGCYNRDKGTHTVYLV